MPRTPPAHGARGWWSTFGDPKLDALVRQALHGNPSLRAAEARVRSARALADAAGASLYPSVRLEASATRQRISANDIYPPPFGGLGQFRGASRSTSTTSSISGASIARARGRAGRGHAAMPMPRRRASFFRARWRRAISRRRRNLAALALARQTLASGSRCSS